MLDAIHALGFNGVPHAFFGRRGGVSTGVFHGLNAGLGSGDDEAAILQNRRLAAGHVLEDAPLVGVYQVHSATCVTVDTPWSDDKRPHADALVTNKPGVLLAILTADCAPVLFVDKDAGVVGAAHAGWKGAISGVVDNTVAAMEALGARRGRIIAAIGPCIAQSSYEVSQTFVDGFLTDDEENGRFFKAGQSGHAWFDLEGYVAWRIAAAGVAKVSLSGLDTYSAPDRFYSYRRATHQGETAYGRQMAVIGVFPAI